MNNWQWKGTEISLASKSARFAIVKELTEPRPRYNDDGEVIGFDPPIVVLTPEQIASILETEPK